MSDRNFSQEIMNRLPYYLGQYNLDTNIGKFLLIEERQYQDAYDTILDSYKILDLDQATGSNLNIFLENLNLSRGPLTDLEARNQIKTDVIANFSKGQLSTIREVCESLFGDLFLGITETWEDPLFLEPSGVVVKLSVDADGLDLSSFNVKRTAAGGVAVYFEIQFVRYDDLTGFTYDYLSGFTYDQIKNGEA